MPDEPMTPERLDAIEADAKSIIEGITRRYDCKSWGRGLWIEALRASRLLEYQLPTLCRALRQAERDKADLASVLRAELEAIVETADLPV